MSKVLRYLQPAITEHLAQQYCLGLLSTITERRMIKLIKQHDEVASAVNQWQIHLSKIVETIAEQPAPDYIWQRLDNNLDIEPKLKLTVEGNSNELTPTWMHWFWPSLSTLFASLFCLSLLLSWQSEPSIQATPSYLAVMQLPDKKADAFIISAYQGTAPGKSQLKLQWLEGQNEQSLNKLILWTIDRKTGQRTAIGNLTKLLNDSALTKRNWLLIKNSAKLQLAVKDRIVYQGVCLQLAAWTPLES